jgi:molecular chaperone GrpE (heat shock protein)
MVSDVVIGASIGVAGTVIGYIISGLSTLKSTNKKISAQEDQLETRLEAQKEQLEKRLEAQKEQLEKQLEAQEDQLESQIEVENKRRRAEYILEKEVNSLINLYEKTEECHSIVQDYASATSKDPDTIPTKEYYDEVKPKLRSLRKSIRQNGIFLTEEEQQEHFNPVLGQVRQADVEIGWRQDNPDQEPPEQLRMDWSEFIDSFENARNFTRQKLRERITALESS